jgi:hypothetical protein
VNVMGLGGLGTRQQSGGNRLPIIPIFSFILLFIGVILFGQELIAYSNAEGNLQTDVEIAGVQVGGLSESQAQERLETVYLDQPIKLTYQGNPILLDPRSAGFRLSMDAMLAQARQQGGENADFWTGFWDYLWGREPDPVTVPLQATLQESQLRAALEDISLRYDAGPGGAAFDLATLTFRGGVQGARLDVEQSMELIRPLFYNADPAARVADLPLQSIEAGDLSMDDLKQAILDYFATKSFLADGVTTIGSVFVLDLETGQEMSLFADVPMSGASTIKVGIMINYFRHRVTAPDPDSAYLLAAAVICSNNSGANFIIQITGDITPITGRPMIDGMTHASQTMLEVGAVNSWITSPLYVGDDGEYPTIAPPARQVTPTTNLNAQPDPFNQTTAEDMGTMMAAIYDCAFRGTGLRTIYPDDITQEECQQMIEVMSGVKFSRFSELGVPEGVQVAHKVGYAGETFGDVAMVFSPARDYVFVMYIWEDDLTNRGITDILKWPLIDETARIVYNYFNPNEPLIVPRQPLNPFGGAACVMPKTAEEISLNDIDAGRFDENGNPLPTACYDYPNCRPFDNWGQ